MPRIVSPAYRVLVVDDGPLNQKLMSGLLSQLGCSVETVSSGEAALARLAEVAFDVVFVDLHMPHMDGQETVARLRADGRERGAPQPLVVILTADEAPPTGDQDWFDLFISKPITTGVLRAAFDVLATKTDDQVTLLAGPPVDLVNEFLEATSTALERMKDGLGKDDFEAIAGAAHGVKGTGSSFGFDAMSALGARIEREARAGSRAGVERGMAELEQTLRVT